LPIGSLASMGSNAKMSEYHAAIGLASLQVWEAHAGQRCELQAELISALNNVSGHRLSWQAQGSGGPLAAPSLLCVRLQSGAARAALEAACQADRITTRRWYQPLLQQMPVLESQCLRLEIRHAGPLAETLLGLPFFLGMTRDQRQRLCDVVAKSLPGESPRSEPAGAGAHLSHAG
jgi:dTDP-4-amino-4,6-dideoxygalactose transaminase